ARRGADRGGAGRRALRDDALWNADRLGQAARPRRLRKPPPAEPRRGEGRRPEAQRSCEGQREPQGGVNLSAAELASTRIASTRSAAASSGAPSGRSEPTPGRCVPRTDRLAAPLDKPPPRERSGL